MLFGSTSEPSRLCRVYSGCESTTGPPGPTRKTDRITAMGRPHLSLLHTHYPMRNLVALRSNVCVHPQDTGLEKLNFNHASTESLFNAVKKQYSNSHLLKLTLPGPPPPGVPSPALLPRLPNNPETSRPDAHQSRTQDEHPTIRMAETDLASTAKFVRELVVESLLPWMGKCVLEWNEAVSRLSPPLRRQGLTRPMHSMWVVSIHHLEGSPLDYSPPPDGCLALVQSRIPPPKAQFRYLRTVIRVQQVQQLLHP